MTEPLIFFIEVNPEERITIEQLLEMVFDSDKDAALALARTEGAQNAVVYPPGDISWHAIPPYGEVFAYPPEVHHARFVEESGKYRWVEAKGTFCGLWRPNPDES